MDDSYRPSIPALNAPLAQEIAAETSRIIGFNVLVTDRDGVVIGSGDTARVGSVHEASLEVMRTRRAAQHTAAQARALHGVKPGMTLPIVLDGEALGTVGITGSPARIRRFGLLVQRHTEILVREAILLRSRLLRDRAVADFLRDLALLDEDRETAALLRERATELGIDLAGPRIAVVVEVPTGKGTAVTVRTVREAFHGPQEVVAATETGRFAVLHHGDDVAPARERCEQLAAVLREDHGLEPRIGLSDPAVGLLALRDAYHDAASAIRLAPPRMPGLVFSIDALRVPQVLAASGQRARFAGLVLRGLPDEAGWQTQRETLIAWAESGFNLVRAADRLGIHRNTLLYRLDRITERTGRSARRPEDALTMYVACLADRLDLEV